MLSGFTGVRPHPLLLPKRMEKVTERGSLERKPPRGYTLKNNLNQQKSHYLPGMLKGLNIHTSQTELEIKPSQSLLTMPR